MIGSEAKTKLCPMRHEPLEVAGNGNMLQVMRPRCIGSACMMSREHINDLGGKVGFYCGLAGKP